MVIAIYANELQSHWSQIDLLRDNSIYDYSYTYNILSNLFISGDWWYATLLTMAVTILLREVVTLLIKLKAYLRNTTLIWSVAFIANARLKLVYRGTLINKSLECVTITDREFSNRVMVWMTPKSTSINRVTILLEQFDFCLPRYNWEIPGQHIANCICLLNRILISLYRQSAVMTCPR